MRANKTFSVVAMAAFILAGCNLGGSDVAIKDSAKPNKVMSLNACADQLLVSLGDGDQISSLTRYAKDKITSPIHEIAEHYHSNHMLPEEIIAVSPNLILTGPYDRDATSKVIAALGIKVERFGVAASIAEAKAMVTRGGAALKQATRATKLNSEIDAATMQNQTSPITALIYYENGYSAGHGTLIDEVMARAGLENMAPQYGVGKWGHVDLEQVIANPPKILILPRHSGDATANPLRHAVLANPKLQIQMAYLPNNLGYCGGEVIIEMANQLKQIRANYAPR